MKNRSLKFLIPLFIALLGLDVWTKYLIKSNMRYGESITVIDGFFNIVYALNSGAAFGIMRNMSDAYRQYFFIGITVTAAILILILMLRENKIISKIGYTLVLTGACGNLIDRIHTGLVVDFLDFYIKSYHWPAFNVADMCITTGIAILIIDVIFFTKAERKINKTA